MIKLVDLLKEQNSTIRTPWTSDKQRDIYVDFNTYLLNKLGLNWQSPMGEIEKKLKLVTDKQLEDMDFIDFFKEKGYQPGSPEIKQFQKDLNVDQLQTATGTGTFTDGNFGAVTAKAALQKKLLPTIERSKQKHGPDYVYHPSKTNDTQTKKKVEIPSTTSAKADISTQSIKK